MENLANTPEEKININSTNGAAWQTVKFLKKKRTNGRASGRYQCPSTQANSIHPIPGKFSFPTQSMKYIPINTQPINGNKPTSNDYHSDKKNHGGLQQ